MSIAPGRQLGPYEILSPLGAGGMGEVYKARDTRLDRTVAVKILPEHLSKDPALRERFEREARAVSSLNHPHICTLHDVGEDDGVHFLVMEHIDGETLAERIKKGPMPLNQALELAAQIADALDKAHRAGIVHRDLKPGNVMLTKPGVKLLDFGLAKTPDPVVAPTEDSEQPTHHKPLTDAGTVLGTVQYMAPEQLEGKEVDARADLFSLGAILFEMVTGRKAFEGQSQASLISAIMSSVPPPISQVRPVSPPALDRVVQRCLEKDPDERRHSAHDLMTDLRWIASLDETGSPDHRERARGGRNLYAVAALVLLAGATATIVSLLPRGSGSSGVYRLDHELPSEHALGTFREANIAISPDGETVVYAARENDIIRLYRRSLREFEVSPIAGTEGARAPFFSPDGTWIAYFAGGALRKVPASGGASQTISDVTAVSLSASWGDDDRILLSPETRSGLRIVSANGGEASVITTPRYDRGEFGHRLPQLLPGSQQALFTVRTGDGDHAALLSLSTGEWRVLDELGPASKSRWLPTGHIVYVEPASNTLMAVPFDLGEEAASGSPVSLGPDAILRTGIDDLYFEIAASGNLLYATTGQTRPGMAWVDRDGTLRRVDDMRGVHPRISPVDDRVAVDVRTAERRDIWVVDARDARTRLTREGTNEFPMWSPDGRFVVFASTRSDSQSLYWSKPDGTSGVEPLWIDELAARPTSWSPDGRYLALESSAPNNEGRNIWVLPIRITDEGPTVSGEPIPLHRGDYDEGGAVFSPDGRWIAYVSTESGQPEVYVDSFPDADIRRPISTSGGSEPMWSRDGTELYFRNFNTFMVVPIETSGSLTVGTVAALFEAPDTGFSTHPHYDVAGNGDQFVVRWDSFDTPSRLRIVLNWFDELERLASSE